MTFIQNILFLFIVSTGIKSSNQQDGSDETPTENSDQKNRYCVISCLWNAIKSFKSLLGTSVQACCLKNIANADQELTICSRKTSEWGRTLITGTLTVDVGTRCAGLSISETAVNSSHSYVYPECCE